MPIAALTCGAIVLGAVALRRVSAAAAFLLAVAATQTAAYLDQGIWTWPALVVIAFFLGRAGELGWMPVIAAVAALAAALVFSILNGSASEPVVAVLSSLAVFVPWWVGSDLRIRHERMMAGWERAERLERERRLVEDAARRAERARVAREMHDGLGHDLSLIAVTAAAAEVDGDLTARQRETIRLLREGAVRSVDTLHEIVDVLREPEGSAEQVSGESVAALIDRHRAAGQVVDAEVTADIDTVPPRVSLGVHRVVQELLTNASRHAPSSTIRLEISIVDGEMRIRSENAVDGGREASRVGRSGAGLAGMSERASLLGGHAEFEQGPDFFRAQVVIPLRDRGEDAVALHGAAADSHRVDGEGGGVPDVERERRRSVRRRWMVAATPLVLAVLVLGILVAWNGLTAARIGMADGVYERLQVGDAQDAVEKLLPPVGLDELPPVLREQASPAEGECRYQRASNSAIDISGVYVRLCFDDGVLVSKERFPEEAP